MILLDHGVPIKKFGLDKVDSTKKQNMIVKILRIISGQAVKYDYVLACSPLHAEANSTAYADIGIRRDNNLCIGNPRNDYLLNMNKEDERNRVKQKYAEILRFNTNKTVLLYLPTFRWKIENTPSFFYGNSNTIERLNHFLEKNNAIIIEKGHNRLVRRNIHTQQDIITNGNLIYVSKMLDTQELLMMSDMMISDYSGCALDYLLLDRPMINYVPDYDYYRNNDTGLYYELSDFAGGPTPQNIDELINCLNDFFDNKDYYARKRKRNRERFLTYEDGLCSEKICKLLTKNNSFDDYCLYR